LAIFKRNIWLLFLLILLGGALFMALMLHQRWQAIVSNAEVYQTNRAELVAQSVDSVLRNKELVLDVIGRELLRLEALPQSSRQIPLLDAVLAEDPDLIGFGLAQTDGRLVLVSSNLDLDKLPNLRSNAFTRDTFLQALVSDVMVLGRTYYVEALNAWVVPVRKALRSESGEVVGVMTAGVRLDSPRSIFGQTLHDGPYDGVFLLREYDGFLQVVSREGVGPETYLDTEFGLSERKKTRPEFEAQLGMSAAEVKQADRAVVVRTKREAGDFLSATLFNRRYQVWVVSETEMTPLWQRFTGDLLQYLITFALVYGAMFGLFYVIARAEQKRNQELLFLSRHDDLTGLLNRNGLLHRLQQLIPLNKPFSLITINIDNFKGVNDRYGQETGDETLIEFGRRLNVTAGPEDDLARLGGDEFVIASPETGLDRIQAMLADLTGKMAKYIPVGHLRIQVTASVGIATFPEHGDALSTLMRSSHLALYDAKQNRNSICLYRTDMEMAYLRRIEVEQRLRVALSENALHMAYQPQVDSTGRVVGIEALLRWQNEQLGSVSPADFVEVAEKSGLMMQLGEFVIQTSLRDFRGLRSKVTQPVDLAINISVIQFTQPGFFDDVMSALETHDVSPRELLLEITETLFIDLFEQALETITKLRQAGVRISMDDFGTGYSSLSLLRKLPLDELKIDKGFIDCILEDQRAAKMIESIVLIAQSHDMELVAEGVEEQAQAEMLIRFGCQRFQGFYFSRPEAMSQIYERLRVQAD
jgi:diguanylate cyclase (GGDEF)-like protein